MKKIILGEAHDILRVMPADQLAAFAGIKNNKKAWGSIQQFVGDQKQIKLDQIYRLRRPKTLDDTVKNAVEHDYHCGKIAAYVVILQIIANAGEELERRERASRKKK